MFCWLTSRYMFIVQAVAQRWWIWLKNLGKLNFFFGFWHWGRNMVSLDSCLVFWEVMGFNMAVNGQLSVMWWAIPRGEAGERPRAESTGPSVVHISAHTESWKHKPLSNRQRGLAAPTPPNIGPCSKGRQTLSEGMHFLATLHWGRIDVSRSEAFLSELRLLRRHKSPHQPVSLSDCMELTLRMLRVIEVKCCAQGHSQLVPEWGLKFMSPDSQGDSSFWQWKRNFCPSHWSHSDWKHGLWDPDSQSLNPASTFTNCVTWASCLPLLCKIGIIIVPIPWCCLGD